MSALLLMFLAGCAHGRLAVLEARVASLEADMARIQGEPLAPGADNEKAATALYEEANALWAASADAPKTVALLDRLHTDFLGTRADTRAARMRTELSVIGREAPPLSVEWIAGSTTWAASPVTLVVFFEEWCPHCAREMPALAARSAALQIQGVQLLGLTKLTRSSTPEALQSFLTANQVHFPVGKENGDLSKAFEVSGIPAAALVRGGTVVWRGHPARLDDATVKRLLGLP